MSSTARGRLLRQVRVFFATELAGVISWDKVTLHEPEDAPNVPVTHRGITRLKRNPMGPYRQIVRINFRDFMLSVYSSEECGPLGKIELTHRGQTHDGVLDHATWQTLGRIIRETYNVDTECGRRTG